MFDGKQARQRVASGGLPLIAGHVEVRTQRPPDLAGIDAGLDGLHGSTAPKGGQHVVDQQRGTTDRTELPLDEFVEFGQPHATKATQPGPASVARDQVALRALRANR